MHGVKETIMTTSLGRIIVNTCPTNVTYHPLSIEDCPVIKDDKKDQHTQLDKKDQ